MTLLRYVKIWQKSKIMLRDHSFIVYIKTEDIYVYIAKDAEEKSNTSNYELDRSSPKGKRKKVIGLM